MLLLKKGTLCQEIWTKSSLLDWHNPLSLIYSPDFGSQSQLAPSEMNICYARHGFQDIENVQKNMSPSSTVSVGTRC
jgi:hypothetical protein